MCFSVATSTYTCVSAHVLSSLIDELMVMVPGEIAQFRCAQEDMVSGLFSVDLPPGEDLVIEVSYKNENTF